MTKITSTIVNCSYFDIIILYDICTHTNIGITNHTHTHKKIILYIDTELFFSQGFHRLLVSSLCFHKYETAGIHTVIRQLKKYIWLYKFHILLKKLIHLIIYEKINNKCLLYVYNFLCVPILIDLCRLVSFFSG